MKLALLFLIMLVSCDNKNTNPHPRLLHLEEEAQDEYYTNLLEELEQEKIKLHSIDSLEEIKLDSINYIEENQ